MRVRASITVGFMLAPCLLASENPFIGKWQLVLQKSKFAAGHGLKDMTVSFELDGDKIHRVADGTYADGKPLDEGGPAGSDFAWDGQEHTVHESSPKVLVRCTPVRNGSTQVTITIDGKLASSTHATVTPDGKTLREESTETDEHGRTAKSVLVFERQ